jgi:hypothetical protein
LIPVHRRRDDLDQQIAFAEDRIAFEDFRCELELAQERRSLLLGRRSDLQRREEEQAGTELGAIEQRDLAGDITLVAQALQRPPAWRLPDPTLSANSLDDNELSRWICSRMRISMRDSVSSITAACAGLPAAQKMVPSTISRAMKFGVMNGAPGARWGAGVGWTWAARLLV